VHQNLADFVSLRGFDVRGHFFFHKSVYPCKNPFTLPNEPTKKEIHLMKEEHIQTLHPHPDKTNKKMSFEKYNLIRENILTVLSETALTHTELMEELYARLKDNFEGSVQWCGETVKLDLEARQLIERTKNKPEKTPFLMLQKLTFLLCGILAFFSCNNTPKLAVPGEPHRPAFHFTPSKMWMNDPNGMVFFEGEYHLFYQHYPDSTVWGPMHWGHAVSKDMVCWEHLPIALYPDSLGYIFSGSAGVDWNNTSGFGKDGKPPLVAIFTHHLMAGEKAGRSDFQYQSLAYSNDRGRTWTKYAGNPVIPNTQKIKDFRDPKMIWDEGSKQWVLALAAGNQVVIWGSPDLKNWKHLSDFGKEYGSHGGVWECPDLFPIQSTPDARPKWVLLLSINPGSPNGGSGTQYFVGDFDGKNFVLDSAFAESVKNERAMWVDWGRDNYAGVTWSDIPKSDGRRLFLGWMSNWDYAQKVPTTAWRSATTLPRELILENTSQGYHLLSKPVKELETLRGKPFEIAQIEVAGAIDLADKTGFSAASSEWILEFDVPAASAAGASKAGEPAMATPAAKATSTVGIELSNTQGEIYRIGYDVGKNQFFSDRTKSGDLSFSDKFATGIHTAPRITTSKTLRMHLYFDVSSAELFADDGATCMTELYFPGEAFSRAKIFAEGENVRLTKVNAWPLEFCK